ncbi:glycosyltransferase family 1 protein [Nakamurella silvestris]|nr:glycosyltransferase family 1 protein [Nakamurella silvestris]
MRRTLLITNDFPPRAGGIQSYVHALAERLPADDVVVYAPAWEGAETFDAAQPFPVFRHPTSLMVPSPAVARRAAALVAEHRLEAAWFGAAAPLALLAPHLRKAGVVRTVASTHGHEVGWSMMPGSRQALGRIGRTNDVITFVSRYARRRIAAALGPRAALEYLPAGVDLDTFRPDPVGRARIRAALGLTDEPVLVCISRLVSRKGQDSLIKALPELRRRIPGVRLLIVGDGPYSDTLHGLVTDLGLAEAVIFTGSVPWADLPSYYAAGDVFAMPCRTRGGGLDVEGLGIVFLEASAVGLPVIAGDSGGAPEAVKAGVTGVVVDGRDIQALATAAGDLLLDPVTSGRMGRAGREWVGQDWNWQRSADRLAVLLSK